VKRRFLLQSLACFALMLGVAVWGARLLHTVGAPGLDLGGGDVATLSPLSRAFIADLEGRLDITFFVSDASRMPSHLKTVEPQVVRLLQALRAQAPDRISYRVVDPDLSGGEGLAYAARRKVSPLSVRQIRGDEQAEQKVWAALVMKSQASKNQAANPNQGRPASSEILIQGIDAKKLPYLEELIVYHLRQRQQPARPVFAVAGGPSFGLLPDFLAQFGDVAQIDLDRDAAIPAHVDLLFWLQPRTVTPAHQRALRAFVAAGGSAVLAGSGYDIEYLWDQGTKSTAPTYRVFSYGNAWARLLAGLGVRPAADLLLDRNSGPAPLVRDNQLVPWPAAFHLRNLPAFRDMKGFALPARGGINFIAASALEFDPRQIEQAGFGARILATTTEHASVLPLPPESFADSLLQKAQAVPRQNLMLELTSQDPWGGRLVLMASASPFRDGIINQDGYGHTVFLRNLVQTLTAPERLALSQLQRRSPPQLPALAAGSRFFWRAWAVFLLPLVLIFWGLWRYRLLIPAIWRPGRRAGLALILGLVFLPLLFLPLASGLWRALSGIYIDASGSGRNTPAPLTLADLRARPEISAEFFSSPRAELPPALKGIEQTVHTLFDDAGIKVTAHRANTQKPPASLAPFRIERISGDSLAPQQVWSGLRLTQQTAAGQAQTVIPRLDAFSQAHLDFLVSAALDRLDRGRAPRLAVIADLPRLSPAEALEDFQKKGLSAPTGTDVYGRAKTLLADYGYQIIYVNPRQPVLPPDIDAVLWLQPRRDAGPLLVQLSRYLAGGGRAVVALQHFNIQQRQYRGAGFQTVYWPQPQFQDFDRYSRLFGIEQAREVLMDRTRYHLRLETQINRSAVREYDPQQVALPFIIRAVGANYAADSPLTKNLGDLLFVWGNRFVADPEKLAVHDIALKTLVHTSEQVWAYDWRGGWLPPAAFAGDPPLKPHQALAVMLEGRFPAVQLLDDKSGRAQMEIAAQGHEPGMLLLVGASEMFKNDLLLDADFSHAQFLLNAVSLAIHGPEMTKLLSRRPKPQGFAFRDLQSKAVWRLIVVGTAPLLLGAYGGYRFRRRKRPLEIR
jgi:hypothetical protein